jgi:hypothetical protein
MAKKLKMSYVALAAVGVFAGVVVLDHYVLKGRLGIASKLNQLLGKFKFGSGLQSQPPIEAAPVPEGGLPPQSGGEGTPLETSLMEAEEELAAEEPTTAAMARRRRANRAMRYARTRAYRGNVRVGGFRM